MIDSPVQPAVFLELLEFIMKIDKGYIKKLLEAFVLSDELSITLEELKSIDSGMISESVMPNKLSAKDKNFIFHIRLLEDMKVIAEDNDRYINNTPRGTVPPKKLRLTASGYDFLETLAV